MVPISVTIEHLIARVSCLIDRVQCVNAVCFAPEEECAAFVVRAIDNPESEMRAGVRFRTIAEGHVGDSAEARQHAASAYAADRRDSSGD